MRAELDAAFFHLYGIERDDVDYIMETFPIVKRKDEQRYGAFRTKELILDVYDAMAEAMRTGVPYQTILDPPPGQGPRHPERDVIEEDALADGQVRCALLCPDGAANPPGRPGTVSRVRSRLRWRRGSS